MFAVFKRSVRPKKSGLTFSSSPPKRRSASPAEELNPAKRVHISPNSESTPEPIHASTELKATKIQTRILVISDTHGLSTLPQKISSDQNIDVVLHCGNLSECGSIEDYENSIDLLDSIAAPLKLVIAGNHDLTLDEEFWASNCAETGRELHDEAKAQWTKARRSSIRLLKEGTHNFTLDNGARLRIYASPYTINSQGGREWAFGYRSIEDRFNPQGRGIAYSQAAGTVESILKTEQDIDVIMTHGPAKYRLDLSTSSESLGCPHLFRAIRRIRPRLHVFGHVHNAYGAEVERWRGDDGEKDLLVDDVDDGIAEKRQIGGRLDDGIRRLDLLTSDNIRKETAFVNSASMGEERLLSNAPWVADIELERA